MKPKKKRFGVFLPPHLEEALKQRFPQMNFSQAIAFVITEYLRLDEKIDETLFKTKKEK